MIARAVEIAGFDRFCRRRAGRKAVKSEYRAEGGYCRDGLSAFHRSPFCWNLTKWGNMQNEGFIRRANDLYGLPCLR
jgi:hypothetical protein